MTNQSKKDVACARIAQMAIRISEIERERGEKFSEPVRRQIGLAMLGSQQDRAARESDARSSRFLSFHKRWLRKLFGLNAQ